MRVTWIGGWGVSPESLRPVAEKHFAQAQHSFFAPTADCIRQVLECGGPPPLSQAIASSEDLQRAGALQDTRADVLVAWSLGAWRVLEAASRGVEFSGMVLLLAPSVAFTAEAQLGGKCSATQVKFLRRWLQREPFAALTDFYKRAGLSEPLTRPADSLYPSEGKRAGVRGLPATEALPYALSDLIEGLDRLAEDASPTMREFAARGLPRNWQALIGDDDPLFEAETVCRSLPGCVRVRGAGHAIADLLRASQA